MKIERSTMRKRITQHIFPKAFSRKCTFISKTFFSLAIAFLILIILILGFTPLALADTKSDLTELSLEELMDVEILTSNVLGTHTHLKGEWMVGYRYMHMHMGGNRTGTTDQTERQVLDEFVVAPLWMDMDMHMIMLMRGVTDDITMMLMLPYIYKKMQHINRAGVKFDTTAHGPGDLKWTTIYALYGNVERDEHTITTWGPHRILLHGGVSFPTGSISKEDTTPARVGGTLPYPMQLGSGTFDFLPGISYLGESNAGNWAWSIETKETVRFGKNSHNYRLGNQYLISGRIARKLTDKTSVSLKLDHNIWGNVHGHDSLVNPTSNPTVPTKRPDLRRGERIDLFIGIDYYEKAKSGDVNKGNRFGLEFGMPVYQSLEGPQLEVDWQMNFAYSLTF